MRTFLGLLHTERVDNIMHDKRRRDSQSTCSFTVRTKDWLAKRVAFGRASCVQEPLKSIGKTELSKTSSEANTKLRI